MLNSLKYLTLPNLTYPDCEMCNCSVSSAAYGNQDSPFQDQLNQINTQVNTSLPELVDENKDAVLVANYNSIKQYENYIRDVIRRDNQFVFQKIIEENITRWLNMRQYRYKNMVFSNYFYYIKIFIFLFKFLYKYFYLSRKFPHKYNLLKRKYHHK